MNPVSHASLGEHLESLVSLLTLEEKVSLLTGLDNNFTVPMPKIGLRSILLSNGPAGVRGHSWDERETSINLPSPINLAATWSKQLAARYGQVLANEAKRKGVDVVLGPTVNMQRTPNAGRHFEAYSEDPHLTARIATALVKATQAEGVGTCTKHYVCNDFETDRFTANVVVSERALREIYLRPFEDVVLDSGAWSLMSAYNRVNGAASTENSLLTSPLRDEWGFDGLMIGDWTAVRTLDSASADQDLVMPGPTGPWGQALVDAVRASSIAEELIDTKVSRLLLLAHRVGALGQPGAAPEARLREDSEKSQDLEFSYRCAVESMTLASNNGILPLKQPEKVALIGHLAERGRSQGGGSAMVTPVKVTSLLDALREQPGIELSYTTGAKIHDDLEPLKLNNISNPETGLPGILAEFLDASGSVIFTDHRISSSPVWVGGDAPTRAAQNLRISFKFESSEELFVSLGYASAFATRISIDGEVFLENGTPQTELSVQSLIHPPKFTKAFSFEAGRSYLIEATISMTGRIGRAQDFFAFQMGTDLGNPDPALLIAQAVEQAKASDHVVLMVGTSSAVESEGFDRQSLELPGHQNSLVEAVLAVNKNVVVVVNSGAPVLLPWRDKVAAILIAHLPGERMGEAIRDVLFGQANPGGRLPTTWPASEEEMPVWDNTPDRDGQMVYAEDIHVGYRAWRKTGYQPAFWFGHGLGFSPMKLTLRSAPTLLFQDEVTTVCVDVENVGSLAGSHVVQLFASKPGESFDLPDRWLVAFEKVWLQPGESRLVEIPIPARELMVWDGKWTLLAGRYELFTGAVEPKALCDLWLN
ncbi:MAG: hypothetical protein RLZZ603_173 [Actinomycetota bacterium]